MQTYPITILNLTIDELNKILENAVEKALTKSLEQPLSDKLFSRKEAACYLKLSLPTFDRLTRELEFPYRVTGRKKLYSQSELNTALKNLKVPTNKS